MKFLKKRFISYIPNPDKLREYKALNIFGQLLYNPNLWHFNRYSVSWGFSVGLLAAWTPIPFQMVLAASLAILIHANLPIAITLVWITNPITMPPLFFFAYKVGSWVLGMPLLPFKFNLSYQWLTSIVADIWQPFLLGCAICGISSALISNLIIRILWRYSTIKLWKKRKLLREYRKIKKK